LIDEVLIGEGTRVISPSVRHRGSATVSSMKHGIRVEKKKEHTIVIVDGWGAKDQFVVKSCNVEKPNLDKDWPKSVREAVNRRLSQDGGAAEGRVLTLFKLFFKGEATTAAVLLFHLEARGLILILRVGTPSGVDRDYLAAVGVLLVSCAKAVAREIDAGASAIRWRVYTDAEEKFARSLGFTKVVGKGNDRTGRILEAAF
jgi:hypothetical protein